MTKNNNLGGGGRRGPTITCCLVKTKGVNIHAKIQSICKEVELVGAHFSLGVQINKTSLENCLALSKEGEHTIP